MSSTVHPETLLGAQLGLRALLQQMTRIGPSDANALILGETGTGKELVAHALHALSPRASGPFVAVNCAALPDGLVESELFGAERGAYTGADRLRRGRFERAHGGTLLLDEIGDASPRVQLALLRAIQERVIERVGGASLAIDVRVVAASHRDLAGLVRAGAFRQDLYFRLNVLTLQVPALRDRPEDIPELVMHFQRKVSGRTAAAAAFAPELMAALAKYSWPGNVRELENAVHRALVLSNGRDPTLADFGLMDGAVVQHGSVRAAVATTEAMRLRSLLFEHGGNCASAARALGIPRTTLVSRAKRFGVL